MYGSSNDPFASFNDSPFSNDKNELNDIFGTSTGKPDDFSTMFGNETSMAAPQNSGNLYNEDDILSSFDSGEDKKRSYDRIFESTS